MDTDIVIVGQVMQCMGADRSLLQRRPFVRDFPVAMVDKPVLPALGIAQVLNLYHITGLRP